MPRRDENSRDAKRRTRTKEEKQYRDRKELMKRWLVKVDDMMSYEKWQFSSAPLEIQKLAYAKALAYQEVKGLHQVFWDCVKPAQRRYLEARIEIARRFG